MEYQFRYKRLGATVTVYTGNRSALSQLQNREIGILRETIEVGLLRIIFLELSHLIEKLDEETLRKIGERLLELNTQRG